jgi:hypothetical protein
MEHIGGLGGVPPEPGCGLEPSRADEAACGPPGMVETSKLTAANIAASRSSIKSIIFMTI